MLDALPRNGNGLPIWLLINTPISRFFYHLEKVMIERVVSYTHFEHASWSWYRRWAEDTGSAMMLAENGSERNLLTVEKDINSKSRRGPLQEKHCFTSSWRPQEKRIKNRKQQYSGENDDWIMTGKSPGATEYRRMPVVILFYLSWNIYTTGSQTGRNFGWHIVPK